MNEWLAFFYSFLFVMSVLGIATLSYRVQFVDAETSRKLIHIGVAHWFFFVPLFESLFVAMVAPVSFIGLNYLSQRFALVKSMERENPADYGTVYYAISLSLITYVSVVFDLYIEGLIAMMILGWGDGLAALVGRFVKSPSLREGKSVSGSLAMVTVSFLVSSLLLQSIILSIGIAILATALEVLTPKGFDNLTVPLIPLLLLWVL
jgi:phytol kinase